MASTKSKRQHVSNPDLVARTGFFDISSIAIPFKGKKILKNCKKRLLLSNKKGRYMVVTICNAEEVEVDIYIDNPKKPIETIKGSGGGEDCHTITGSPKKIWVHAKGGDAHVRYEGHIVPPIK